MFFQDQMKNENYSRAQTENDRPVVSLLIQFAIYTYLKFPTGQR